MDARQKELKNCFSDQNMEKCELTIKPEKNIIIHVMLFNISVLLSYTFLNITRDYKVSHETFLRSTY